MGSENIPQFVRGSLSGLISGDLIPNPTLTYNLGDGTHQWLTAYLEVLKADKINSFAGAGIIVWDDLLDDGPGTVNIGSAGQHFFEVYAIRAMLTYIQERTPGVGVDIKGHLFPNATGLYNIGSSGSRFQRIWTDRMYAALLYTSSGTKIDLMSDLDVGRKDLIDVDKINLNRIVVDSEQTFIDGDLTPTVLGYTNFTENYTGGIQDIADFDDAVEGQVIEIRGQSNLFRINDNANIQLLGGINRILTANRIMRFTSRGGVWYQSGGLL